MVFSLGRWASQIPTGFHVSRGTQVVRTGCAQLSHTGLSPSAVALSRALLLAELGLEAVCNLPLF